MDWAAQVDAYCERTGPGLWAEPLNAFTNLAFLIAAIVAWRRARGADLVLARAMAAVLALVGLASGAWHTLALAWTGAADSLSILIFILLYLYAANRAFWGMSVGLSLLGVALFFPYAAVASWLVAQVPLLERSAVYWPVAFLIAGYAVALRHRAPATAARLLAGAALLGLSILLRSLDAALCPALPVGTHFAWHLLNATMLGWMIETYRRHRLAAQPGRR